MTTVQRLLASVCCLLVVSLGQAESMASLPVDIAPQPLAQALFAFCREMGLQLAYEADIATTLQSKGARAGQSTKEAIGQLLQDTGLTFEFIDERTVRVYAAPVPLPAPPNTSVPTALPEPHKKQLLPQLGATVVTATRREERVNKVPISIALWTQKAMEASGIKSMIEIGALTPGVDFAIRAGVGGDLYTDLAIRGVSGHGGSVGIYLDDTQIPPARVGTYLRSFPLTFDLDRVEVLRGPQTTLLGDHTQSGAVRFIMKQPSLAEFSALARTELATTADGSTSYEVGAAAGGPMVSNVLGFRISGWYREDGGYVDRVDPFTGATVEAKSNRYVSETVRGALTYAPAEAVEITSTLDYQSTMVHDTSTFYTTLS